MPQILKKFAKILPSVILVGSIFGIVSQRQNIYDWWRLHDYEPPQRIVQIADRTTMNDNGRKIFYVNRPEFQDNQAFNATCHRGSYSIVLGCYISGRGIFIYDVKDERLNGIHEVTAAHELLHAAYERLNEADRQNIDRQLSVLYDSLQNTRIKETVDLYKEQDASVVPNELHSIIGTEVRHLPKEIEVYYGRYFKDRSSIVNMAEQYEQVFLERKNAVREFDEQLSSLRLQIETIESTITGQYQTVESEQQKLNQMRNEGQYDEFNARVSDYNELVRQYNSALNKARALIQEYNRIVQERNAIASEEQELIEAIDSRRLPESQ